MRIQLKQKEIEIALKGYIASQGIVVTNKDINMDFTSGRKNNGLSVEIVIEEAVTPIPQKVSNPPSTGKVSRDTVAEEDNSDQDDSPAKAEAKPTGEDDPTSTLSGKSLFR